MICPKCKELNQKSIVTPHTGYCTAAYYAPYYDEDGKYHNHDGNSNVQNHSCSQGHYITIVLENKCGSCDWYKEGSVKVSDLNKLTS